MKRRSYSDKFRASAIIMLEANGWPDDQYAAQRTADHLKMPVSTLRAWATGIRNAPPPEVRDIKKAEIIQAIRAEAFGALDQMGKVREEASYRDLATAFGILTDKLQLLTGEATERTEDITKRIKEQLPWQHETSDGHDKMDVAAIH